MKAEGTTPAIRSVAVFCGSSFGTSPEHAAAATRLGTLEELLEAATDEGFLNPQRRGQPGS